MFKGLYVLSADSYDKIYGPTERADIAELVDVYAPPQTPETVRAEAGVLAEAEVIFSGWGGAKMDEPFLAAAPKLRAVFYGAGSVRGIVTEAFWDRGIVLCSAWGANAVPVAEYTLGQVLFALKRGWHHVRALRRERQWRRQDAAVCGGYGSTVGIISLGMVGRAVCRRLEPFEVDVLAYDPFVTEAVADELGVRLCGLDEIFTRCDVVSLHTPKLKVTEGMITGEHFSSMKPNATFINTARGAVVREAEMIDVLRRRSDLLAVLDVTEPEPPADGSALWTLDNVVLTPHIAGSMGSECNRHGRYMVDELRRFAAGEALKWSITRETAASLA